MTHRTTGSLCLLVSTLLLGVTSIVTAADNSGETNSGSFLTGAVVVLLLVVLGTLLALGASKTLDEIREKFVGRVYSEVRGNAAFALVATGSGVRLQQVDDFKFGAVSPGWLILRPGSRRLTINFETSMRLGGRFSRNLSLPQPVIQSFDVVAGCSYRLAALVGGKWLFPSEGRSLSVFDVPVTAYGVLPNSGVEFRLVDWTSSGEAITKEVREVVAMDARGRPASELPVPDCFRPVSPPGSTPAAT